MNYCFWLLISNTSFSAALLVLFLLPKFFSQLCFCHGRHFEFEKDIFENFWAKRNFDSAVESCLQTKFAASAILPRQVMYIQTALLIRQNHNHRCHWLASWNMTSARNKGPSTTLDFNQLNFMYKETRQEDATMESVILPVVFSTSCPFALAGQNYY